MNECKTDPNTFWRTIGKVGIFKERGEGIPFETYDSDGNVVFHWKWEMHGRWKKYFAQFLKRECTADIRSQNPVFSLKIV